MNKQLDAAGGVDAWQLQADDQRMRGLASRVQWIEPGTPVWNSFSIRATTRNGGLTEWHKRSTALADRERGWLVPHLTIQAYVSPPPGSGGCLLSAAVVKTADLYEYAKPRWASARTLKNPVDGNQFKVFFWSDLARAGVRIKVTAR